MVEMKHQEAVEATHQAEEAQQATQTTPTPQIVATQPTVAATSPMLFIFMRESGNDPGAINPSSGACGLGQALPCSKMPCSLNDYDCQVAYFTDYANSRYGGWDAAYQFWLGHNWW